MRKMKRVFAIVLALSMVFALAACGASGAETAAEPEKEVGSSAAAKAAGAEAAAETESNETQEDILVGLTLMFYDDPYFLDMRNAVKEFCDVKGWGFTEFDAAADAAAQSDAVENMIASGIDALVIAAVDSTAIIPQIEKCNEAGIPVVCVDAGVDGGEYLTLVETDNFTAGYLCGEQMIKATGGEGKICVTNCPSGSAARDREAGFREAIKDTNLEIVDTKESVSQTVGMEIGDTWAIAFPDVAGVFTIDDNSGLGVEAAFKNAGIFVPICSVDGSSTVAEHLVGGADEGFMYNATAAQQPILIAVYAMKALAAYFNGEANTVEHHIMIDAFLVTAENAQDYLDGKLTTYDIAY